MINQSKVSLSSDGTIAVTQGLMMSSNNNSDNRGHVKIYNYRKIQILGVN